MSTDSFMTLLVRETEKLTEFLAAKKFTSEYENCKDGIKQIQAIPDIRKETTLTPHPIVHEHALNATSKNQDDPDNSG